MTPQVGTIAWAQRWRALHPSGVDWPPLYVEDDERPQRHAASWEILMAWKNGNRER